MRQLSIRPFAYALATLSFIALPFRAHADNGHLTFPRLPHATEERFLTSIFDGASFERLFPKSEIEEPDAIIRGIWSGNKASVSGRIKRLTLRLRRELPGQAAKVASATFTLRRDGVAVDRGLSTRKSKHEDAESLGALIKNGDHRILRVVSEGTATEMLLIVPQFADSDTAGFLLCPRALGVTSESEDEDYEADSLTFEVEASAEGRVLSGLGLGLARATIETSFDIAHSTEPTDRAIGRDPSIALVYQPSNERVSYHYQAHANGSGIQATLELQNSAGYKRTLTEGEVAWLEKVHLPADGFERLEDLTVQKFSPKVSCFMLLSELDRSERYSKEAPPVQ